MTDKELLELAAKAVGEKVVRPCDDESGFLLYGSQDPWNPLTDDGDALRLAVRLNAVVGVYPTKTNVTADGVFLEELHQADPYAATRRAIVRAAAEIGKGMK